MPETPFKLSLKDFLPNEEIKTLWKPPYLSLDMSEERRMLTAIQDLGPTYEIEFPADLFSGVVEQVKTEQRSVQSDLKRRGPDREALLQRLNTARDN